MNKRRVNRRGLAGHSRLSLGLGAKDPRARREAQSRVGEGVIQRDGGLRANERGKIEVDLDTLAAAVSKRLGGA